MERAAQMHASSCTRDSTLFSANLTKRKVKGTKIRERGIGREERQKREGGYSKSMKIQNRSRALTML